MSGRVFRILVSVACLVFLISDTTPAAAEDDPAQNLQWGLAKVRAAEAWGRSAGAGTSIAIVDSGVDVSHVEFADRILPGVDFTDTGSAQDDCGHGTHVAGIASAAAGNGHGGAGVAPAAKIIPVKVLSPDGDGCSGTRAADGIKWAADQGATVINVSLGGDAQFILGPSFADAIRYAWDKGSITVASAGNIGFGLPSGFGRNDPVIVVVATDTADRKASYSNDVGAAQWGIAAPGGNGGRDEKKDIFSTYWKEGAANSYAFGAGTSMAAPFVSGAAAVLRSLGMSKEQTVEILRTTAVREGCGAAQCGAGRLDVAAAVAKVPVTAPPPGDLPSVPTVAPPGASRSGTTRRPASASAARRPSTAGESEAPQPEPPTGPVVPDSNLEDQAAAGAGRIGIGNDSSEERPWSLVAFASSILAIAGAWAAVVARREYNA